VPNKRDYITEVQAAVQNLHGCAAIWVESVPVRELFRGKVVWDGEVEVFSLVGHPKAKYAYAWAHLDGKKDEKTRYVAVLEIPPVEDAKTAVQASIVADSKNQ
jgi:hypothetical protein